MAEEMTPATWEEIEEILKEHMLRFADRYERLAGETNWNDIHLTSVSDPVLSRVWDNDEDTIFDLLDQKEREIIAGKAARELIEEISKKWKPIPIEEKEKLVYHLESEPDD